VPPSWSFPIRETRVRGARSSSATDRPDVADNNNGRRDGDRARFADGTIMPDRRLRRTQRLSRQLRVSRRVRRL